VKSHQVNLFWAGFIHLKPPCCCRRCSERPPPRSSCCCYSLCGRRRTLRRQALRRRPSFRSQRRAASLCTGKRSPKPSWPAKSNTYNSTVQKRGAKACRLPFFFLHYGRKFKILSKNYEAFYHLK
jgi:hypothetical protein